MSVVNGSRELARIQLLRREVGHHLLANLKPHIIADYRDQRLRTVKPSTVRRELGLLRSILNIAAKDWGITLPGDNPVTLISIPAEPKGRDRRLEAGEEGRLKAALSHSPLTWHIVNFAMETAMRRGEIASMKWGQVNTQARTIHIPVTKTDTPRYVPLSNRAMLVLNTIPRLLDDQVWGMNPRSITQAFNRACKRAGIDNLRFHDLRHEATSRFFEKGLNVMEVASITGHQDLRMLRRYTHIRAETLVDRL